MPHRFYLFLPTYSAPKEKQKKVGGVQKEKKTNKVRYSENTLLGDTLWEEIVPDDRRKDEEIP